MSFDVAPQQDLYTRQGVAVTVEAVAQIRCAATRRRFDRGGAVSDQAAAAARGPDPAGDGRHLRGIIGQLTVEQIVKEPEMVGERMRATCAEDMSKMGLE